MLISFEDAALLAGGRILLEGLSWQVREGEHWAVLGPNGSGKSTLLRAVLGDVPVVRGSLRSFCGEAWNPPIGWVSYELHRRIIAREEARDAARWFSAQTDGGGRAGELLLELQPEGGADRGWVDRLVEILALGPLLGRPFRGLSTGEIRRLLVARALVRRPSLLALDEPFDGLDEGARRLLTQALGRLTAAGLQLLQVSHRVEELLPEVTHVLGLRAGRVLWQGPRRRALSARNLRRLYGRMPTRPRPSGGGRGPASRPPVARSPLAAPQPAADAPDPEILIRMRGVTVHYGDKVVLEDLDWTVHRGENWCVQGPNGSGKTTLLSLICGDHPQAYANDIRLFGVARGSGESIWDIKRRMGLLSTELQVGYRREASGLEVVVSGFHDSIGLYERPSPVQEASARRLVSRLDLQELAGRDFDSLSGGEQRLLLLARAAVKQPELLVLDEPCQGLDPANRGRVLAMIDRIAAGPDTQLIYVSHHRDELPLCLTHRLQLPGGSSGRIA